MTAPIAPTFNAAEQPNALRPMFHSLRIASSGLAAQRFRMEVVAQNLANAETTRTPEGGPYQRQVVSLEAVAMKDGDETTGGVRVVSVAADASEGPLVYDPGHPDADPSGYVRMPNISTTEEMLDLMNARRVYEANATVFQVAKAMLRRAIDI
jgi:flagellar basal-body rod protein FlgC